VSVYRVTDEDGENVREIDSWSPVDAAEEYAAMVHDNGDDPRDMNVIVDGKTYHVVVEWNHVYYAMEVKL